MQHGSQAPGFVGNHDWINVSRPLSLEDLRGKLVLLDFWTYCCINCMHVVPDLAFLEEKFRDQLVVIGVHSAKFRNERLTRNIRQAMWRYGIRHPVVNDADLRIWRSYGVNAWPTFTLIDETGEIVIRLPGEGNRLVLDTLIERLIVRGRSRETLQEGPFPLWKPEPPPQTPLLYPGKVLADAPSGRLFIADSSHHRILVTDLSGNPLEVIGSGASGLEDGTFERARFNNPQGMALRGGMLYVADTDNHCLRRIDFNQRVVESYAGTGKQGFAESGGPSRRVMLNSPWDLCWGQESLFVAMAGSHQIWRLDPTKDQLEAFAGSGQEDIEDGPRFLAKMAQPSGLAFDGTFLYSADSETSSIRRIELTPGGWVRSLVGKGLFVSGDTDGMGDRVRLQHPLGIATEEGRLYIADTYNHKIKGLSPLQRESVTLYGNGQPGFEDGPVGAFYEPGGVSVANGVLYVADTNNHAIRKIDRTGVHTLDLGI